MKRWSALFALLTLSVLVAAPATAQDSARIHLLHGIPGVDVDVVVDGDVVFSDFAFSEAQDLSALAGQTLVDLEVRVAGTTTVAIDAGDLALPASGNFTAIAHLDEAGTPTLAVFANDTSSIAAGEGRLTVRHTAEAPAVDVWANGAVAFSNLTNPNEVAADLAADTYTVEVTPTGASDPVVIGPADLAVNDGDSLIVYAVGSLGDGSLTVLTESVTGLGASPTGVPTGNSPVDGEGGGLSILALGLAALVAVSAGGAVVRAKATR